MEFDILFVTYNSEKWIDNCIKSIAESDYDLKKVSLIFYDNNSKDKTIEKLNSAKEKYEKTFKSIVIKEGKSNKGFGYGNNCASKLGDAPYLFFLNIDTEIKKDTLKKLENSINNSDEKVAVWELKQTPYEHPKYFDPLTGYTSWASGACVVFKRNVFEEIKGFDSKIFMYCEDVEISWNVRKRGYLIKYLWNNPIVHHSYNEKNEFKFNQFLYGFLSNMYVRAKYGSLKNYLRGVLYVFNLGFKKTSLPAKIGKKECKKIQNDARKYLLKNFIPYLFINMFSKKKVDNDFKPSFVFGIDYEIGKNGAFYELPDIETNVLVSIIVRTCGRPDTLRETLKSIEQQTYKNIEVVIVEDGKATADKMINEEFKHMNIKYKATGKKVGRSNVGNMAMELASGKYLNFLDDDDLFYPDHVETLVKELEIDNSEIAYCSSFETAIIVDSRVPYKYRVMNKGLINFGIFNRFELYTHNMFPIQTVMFKKELFEECGGLDPTIDALEDWDFWVRLSLRHNYKYVDKTTSLFRTPFNEKERADRNEFLQESLDYLSKKFETYKPEINVNDFNKRRW